jgi:hypothetical protein
MIGELVDVDGLSVTKYLHHSRPQLLESLFKTCRGECTFRRVPCIRKRLGLSL